MRHCTTHALYRSRLWQPEPLPAPSKCVSKLPRITGTCPEWWKQSFRLRLWSLEWFQVRATSCHLISSKSSWKSTPKCTSICWKVCWSPGVIRWPVADPRWGSRTRRRSKSPKRPRPSFRRSATTCTLLSPAPSSPAGLLRLDIGREHHQHDLSQHQSQPDRRHPPSYRRRLWKRHAPSSGSVSRHWLRLKADTLNRFQLY